MKRFFTSVVFIGCSLLLWNCKDNDDNKEFKERDRQEVYNKDISDIETFLKSNSLTVLENEIKFDSVSFESSNSIWKQGEYSLNSIMVKNLPYSTNQATGRIEEVNDNVEYKIYYLILNEGGGKKPSLYDNIFSAYTGYNLNRSVFDNAPYGNWSGYPANGSALETITGYRQILEHIKTASGVIENEDGTYTYDNPGRVLVFLPSGLGYFSTSKGSIAAYAPIIFDIKSIAFKEVDHDNDGILTKYEDINENGNLWDDDTDGDGKANFLDLDDDGDGYTTREEITYTVQENGETVKKIYEFDKIPSCQGGSVKKHLDKSCH